MSGVSCRDARIGFLSMRPVLVRHPASSNATFSEAAASAIGYFSLPACDMTACDALSSNPYSRTRLPAWESQSSKSHTLRGQSQLIRGRSMAPSKLVGAYCLLLTTWECLLLHTSDPLLEHPAHWHPLGWRSGQSGPSLVCPSLPQSFTATLGV